MTRVIVHVAVGDFLVTAAQQFYPHLHKRPFVIAPVGYERAAIQAASPAARQLGIGRGLSVKQARQRCRELIIHPFERRFYDAVNRELVAVASQYSPVVEPHFGRLFLELATGQRQPWHKARDLALHLQHDARMQVSLTPAVGIASNKLVSHAASAHPENESDILWVQPGDEATFIAPFDVDFLPHVNWERAATLHNLNVVTARDLRALAVAHLQELFGAAGRWMHREAYGIDISPVVPPQQQPALHEEWRFQPPTNEDARIRAAGHTVLGRLARQLRETRQVAGHLALAATHADSRFFAAGRVLVAPSNREEHLLAAFAPLLERLLARRVALKRMSITLTRLQADVQIGLFTTTESRKSDKLVHALDAITTRYGDGAVYWGREHDAR